MKESVTIYSQKCLTDFYRMNKEILQKVLLFATNEGSGKQF